MSLKMNIRKCSIGCPKETCPCFITSWVFLQKKVKKANIFSFLGQDLCLMERTAPCWGHPIIRNLLCGCDRSHKRCIGVMACWRISCIASINCSKYSFLFYFKNVFISYIFQIWKKVSEKELSKAARKMIDLKTYNFLL